MASKLATLIAAIVALEKAGKLKAEPFPSPGRSNVPCDGCGVWEGDFHKPECPVLAKSREV